MNILDKLFLYSSSYIYRFIRKVKNTISSSNRSQPSLIYNGYCQYIDQEGNDAILSSLESYKGGGFMISKFGTIELSQIVAYIMDTKTLTWRERWNIINQNYHLSNKKLYKMLCENAGVFPATKVVAHKFARQALIDSGLIDILGSYIKNEDVVSDNLKTSLKVNLDAFYAPFLWKRPWTKWLEGKHVLIIHPFVESIEAQYKNNREKLFDNPNVLPKFASLQCIKAVQSQAGEETKFQDWFEALQFMEDEIDKYSYDVAIIGCGAYGMSLAAYVKRQGKVAIHLAGWTQMLFGVYGNRWLRDQPQYAKFINKYWVRPNETERIKNGQRIENACYW